MRVVTVLLALLLPVSAAAAAHERFDVVVRGGAVYDGTGAPGRKADVGMRGERIAAVGDLSQAEAGRVIDAKGLAVSPGFINMLSWATDSLMVDGRSMSDVKQGVTLEIFGEGWSMGPLTDAMKKEAKSQQGDIKYDIPWTTLGEYLDQLVARGISPNIASFVGATTLRVHELGYADRAPTPEELERMQGLVREAMREGALGVGASLIYAPAFYAKPDELLALTKAAAESGGGYIAHMRSEANRLLEATDELIGIARDANVHGEIYHMKAAGQANWPKMAQAIARVDAARAAGVSVSANMYTYVAGATGLDAAMPPWVQEGGLDAWVKRLQDPAIRARVIGEMRAPTDDWENVWMLAGSPERVKFIGFKTEKLKPLTGRTLAQVMKQRGTSAEDTMIDLVIEDHTRVETAYFLMSEDNVKLGIRQPWVAFGSDAESSAPEGVFLKSSTHPRAYGNVARLLGRYVRDEKVITLPEAIRRLTRLPADHWKLKERGCLDVGCYADLVVFDPARIEDHATFEKPQQYATGVRDVFVNGVQVLRNGKHTGEKPGRVVRGPGWRGGGAPDAASQPIPGCPARPRRPGSTTAGRAGARGAHSGRGAGGQGTRGLMEAREEPGGSLVLTYDGTPLAKWLAGVAAVLVATAVYDSLLGSRGTDRLIGLLAGAGTCAVAALALLEKSDFRFDPVRRLIVWSRRWGFRRRSGSVPFHEVQRVVVEAPIGDSGIPSRRICLRLADGSLLPVTVGYRPDVDDKIEHAAARARAILGHDTAPTPTATAQEFVDHGNTIAAVRVLVEKEGLTLAEAKQRVDAMS